MMRPKEEARPVRLSGVAYRELCTTVLERDRWRCQYCGRREQLQIHHLVHRSCAGADCEENLIVLCASCHRLVHGSAI